MKQGQLGGILIAGYLLLITTGAVLYFRGSLKGKQIWMAFGPKGQLLAVVYLIGFNLWLGSALAVRPWAAEIGLEGHWTLGVAPSLFAGVTVTAFIACIWRLRPLLALVHGTALVVLVEVVQLWLPNYVFDPHDVFAGLLGTALVTMLLRRYSLRTRAISGTHDVGKGSATDDDRASRSGGRR